MNAFLASAIAPWVIVLVVLAVGLLAGLTLARMASGWRWVGRGAAVIFGCAALVLAIGAGVAQANLHAELRAHPPQGQMVDLGGYKVRVLCEGPRTPLTLLWLTGGYSQAMWLDGLHQRMKGEIRSCEIDRPGTGYSDVGPLPLTVDRVLAATHDALAKAGETGPLVIVGHSMGGLFAANYAQSYPAQVKGIVLLDPTPVAWNIEEQATFGCEPLSGNRFMQLETMFGLGTIHALNPLYGPEEAEVRDTFDPKTWDLLVTLESQPKSLIVATSVSHAVCANPFALVRGPGSLGSLPVMKVIQTETPADVLAQAPPGLTPRERMNWLSLRNGWAKEYVGDTKHGTLVYAPHGWGHYFPVTHPDFALGQVRVLLAQVEDQKARP